LPSRLRSSSVSAETGTETGERTAMAHCNSPHDCFSSIVEPNTHGSHVFRSSDAVVVGKMF
jgi:hypothetical protein